MNLNKISFWTYNFILMYFWIKKVVIFLLYGMLGCLMNINVEKYSPILKSGIRIYFIFISLHDIASGNTIQKLHLKIQEYPTFE
jgi:hypothetical protein